MPRNPRFTFQQGIDTLYFNNRQQPKALRLCHLRRAEDKGSQESLFEMHQADICTLQSCKDPTLKELQPQHICWNADNSKCNTRHGVLVALLKAQDNLAIVVNCLTNKFVDSIRNTYQVPCSTQKNSTPYHNSNSNAFMSARLRGKLSSHHRNRANV